MENLIKKILHYFGPIFTIILISSYALYSQEKGKYFIRNFDPKETGATAQTWTGIEDDNGVLYFATGTKISTYDGKNWFSVKLTNDAPPLSLCKDESGIIYVGAVGEIGYLTPSKNGKLEYVSLKKFIPKQYKNFQNVWTCASDDGYTYFSTDAGIFSWNGKEIKYIKKSVFFTLNKVNDRIFFCSKSEGLLELVKGEIKPAKNAFFFKNIAIVGGVSLSDSEAVFLTGNEATITYNYKTGEINNSKYNFKNYNKELFSAMVYSVEKTFNNKIVIGTIYNGLYIFDLKGTLLNRVTVEEGLINNAINKVFNDRIGNLWLCTDKGTSRIEINSGIKSWNVNEGVEGAVEDIIVYNNTTYIASSTSLKYLKEGKFVPINNIGSECWRFHIFRDKLYVANSFGLIEIDDANKTSKLVARYNTAWTLESANNKLYIGTSDGIFQYNPETKLSKQLTSSNSPIRSLAIDQSGNIWFATDNKGIGFLQKNGKILHFNKSNGLLNETNNQIFKVQNKIYIATKNGLLKPNNDLNKLIPACDFGAFMCSKNTGVWRLKDNGSNQLFTSTYGETSARFSIINLKNNRRDTTDLKRLPKMHIYSFFSDKSKLWLATPDGVYQYDKGEIKNVKYRNKTLIRRVVIGKDSSIFEGNFRGGTKNKKISVVDFQPKEFIPIIEYDLNEINFLFTNPFYSNEEKTTYQYKLIGFDEDWSDWTKDNFKNYTNLFEGKYDFQVRAKNVLGQISEIGSYRLIVSPPWYRTYIAYTLYVLLLISLIYFIIRLYTKKLREDNLKLEQIIHERTAEVVKQRDEIQEKNQMITESIEYAKTIQEAIITSNEYFKNLFADLFILFKPKDIVSGDFYWAYKSKSNKIFWVAADCTGHGVPGAFMTMIGMSLLNEIIIENEIEETNEILDNLRESIIKTLNKNIDLDSDEKMRNGMDIALCCWNLETDELSYSGANNPMYILRDHELMEFKSDKQPIGIYKKMTPFTKQSVKIQKGDKIYIFSDGYADQMNPEESRFKIMNLKKAILEHGDLKTQNQGEVFSKIYEDWKGDYDQMDDVVLIGVEI